jgi:hypothetical protein
MWGVTAGGPGLVAVGITFSGFDADAAVWTSVDGLTWSRVHDDGSVLGGPATQAMYGVTAGGPGLVAVGEETLSGSNRAAVWTSVDGLEWSRVPHDAAIFGGQGTRFTGGDHGMLDVTTGGPGLVAVGYGGKPSNVDAAVWTSPDGLVWEAVPQDPDVFGGEGDQRMISVVAGGPGLVAVGQSAPGGNLDAAVWVSLDGLTWSRVPDSGDSLGGDGWQNMLSVTVGGPGLVAVGFESHNNDDDAAVWTSTG